MRTLRLLPVSCLRLVYNLVLVLVLRRNELAAFVRPGLRREARALCCWPGQRLQQPQARQERDRKLGVEPSTSVSHSSSHSALVRAHREAATGERAAASAEGISKAIQPELNLHLRSLQDLAQGAHHCHQESVGEVIAGVINTNSPQCISVAPDRGKTAETAETTADVVLLTRAGVAHDPILPDAWTFPSHPVPQADVDADTDTIVILQRKRKRQWPASER
ncbi:BZ3500_MvSof-1268-A1-R1_Chr8-1g09725 [Microbotryum saponariae]|uniref:BZ3500_MvSof-1268-A1-R1_Chr8-1g09725 protein n=1 Tax=Microbotryum saponariae TaxID=289078 RepID=A0A2X0LLI7_9BASI|nr:BZ3500_MvSof-1268-A1-R1_Chr8-1g09725 [Microbotryum saponariae]SDA08011.1 BZ3501_MvSof-1269-A2-R1_Chr8-1g09448 [Microbotryum saponariae]